jgi:hypothetical protein
MILSAHQPAYLPWGGWYDKVRRSDIFVILDQVQYERGSFVNRTDIVVGGKLCRLTIPIERGHLGERICDKKVIVKDNWWEYHCNKIREGYKDSSKWYTRMEMILQNVINNAWMFVLGEMQIYIPSDLKDKKIVKQSDIGVTGKKLDLIVNLCHHFGADQFLFGELGKNYCDEAYLRSQGIEPLFQHYEDPKVSIIDSLFNGRPW